jgi:Flp pilus assembly protein TadD
MAGTDSLRETTMTAILLPPAWTARHRGLRQVACCALLSLALASCATQRQDRMTTGSIPTTGSTGSTPSLSKPLDTMTGPELAMAERSMGAAYERNPRERATGLAYANILRMNGKNTQALAVMQQVVIAYPSDRAVLAAYGKAQAGAGQLEQALATITRAQTPDRPDWRLYSAEGAVLDQLGRSDEARRKYRMALESQPNEPSVLSNLGMSYVLSGDLRTAETYLRTASQQPSADSRVRQNLALVIGLQGRFSEAEQIARRELSPVQAEANVTYLRDMLTQQNAWAKLADKDGKPKQAIR